jgi:hypothetical protein
VITRVLYWSLSWATSIQPTPPHPISPRSVLILSTHLRLGLPTGLIPSGCPTNNLKAFPSYHSCYIPCPSHPPWFDNSKYTRTCHNSGHYQSSCLSFKTALRRLDTVSVFRRNLLSWAQYIILKYHRHKSKDLIALGEKYKLWSSLCRSLQLPNPFLGVVFGPNSK